MDVGNELRRCETELSALRATPGAAALLNESLTAFLQSAGAAGSTITFTIHTHSDRLIVENNYKVSDCAEIDGTRCTVHATVKDDTKDRKTITINGSTEWMMQLPFYVETYQETTDMWKALREGTGALEVEKYHDCIFFLKKGQRELVFRAMHKLAFEAPNRNYWPVLRRAYGVTDAIHSDLQTRCYVSFTTGYNGKNTIIINGITFTTNAADDNPVWRELLTGTPSTVREYDENSFSIENAQPHPIRFEKQQA